MSQPMLAMGRAALLPALSDVFKVVEKRSTIPILSNVRLRAEAGRLTLTGTDLDAEMSASIDCATTGLVDFTLPAGLLHDAVRKLPANADIRIAADTNAATVSSGRSTFRLPILPSADFPVMTVGDFDVAFEMPAEDLMAMFDTVDFAISTEETRYYLNGIYWHVDTLFNAVATDGHRLAKSPIATPAGAESMPAIIIPRATIALLQGMLDKDGTVQINVSTNKLRVTYGDTVVVSKLIDGTYPDYGRVVPANNENRFTLSRQALSQAVDRVITIATGRGAAVKFNFGDGLLKLAVQNPDSGSAEEEMAIDGGAGDPVEIGFNGRYCLDLLAACRSDQVTFALGDPGAPALVTPAGAADPAPIFVLMPMRV